MELLLLEPPRFEPVSLPRRGISVRPGILFARLALAETEDYEALTQLRGACVAAPWMPLAVHVPTQNLAVLSRLPAILTASGARAFIPGDPDIDVLRTTLVDPVRWRSQLPAWADVVWPDLPPNVRAMLDAVLEHDQPPAMDNGRPTSRRVVNRRLAMAGLGPHRRLLAILRSITALHYLWERPDRTVAQAAVSSPARYADPTSFSNQCLALYGYRPREMRSVLAWEWPLWAALRRGAAVARNLAGVRDDQGGLRSASLTASDGSDAIGPLYDHPRHSVVRL